MQQTVFVNWGHRKHTKLPKAKSRSCRHFDFPSRAPVFARFHRLAGGVPSQNCHPDLLRERLSTTLTWSFFCLQLACDYGNATSLTGWAACMGSEAHGGTSTGRTRVAHDGREWGVLVRWRRFEASWKNGHMVLPGPYSSRFVDEQLMFSHCPWQSQWCHL